MLKTAEQESRKSLGQKLPPQHKLPHRRHFLVWEKYSPSQLNHQGPIAPEQGVELKANQMDKRWLQRDQEHFEGHRCQGERRHWGAPATLQAPVQVISSQLPSQETNRQFSPPLQKGT